MFRLYCATGKLYEQHSVIETELPYAILSILMLC